jgi:hypothetical protein
MTTDREVQPERWWREKMCPLWAAIKHPDQLFCEASDCAFWRETARDNDGNKCGICTKS